MSTAESVQTEGFPKKAASLLLEYVRRVNSTRDALRDRLKELIETKNEFAPSGSLVELKRDLLMAELESISPLRNAVRRFVQRVSQHLEHEVVDDGNRWELELRIADLEQSLQGLSRQSDAIVGWTNRE